MKKIFFLFIILILLSCSVNLPLNSADPYLSKAVSDDIKEALISGRASVKQLRSLKDTFYNWQKSIKGNPAIVPESAFFLMPATGKLSFVLEDNDAGWRSEVYIKIGDEYIQIIDDTREGPLNTATEFEIKEGTAIDFFIVTHPNEYDVVTNYANSKQCKWEHPDELNWKFSFEDVPESGEFGAPDWDYNDCVFSVEVIPDQSGFIDLSSKLDVSVEYLDYHGTTEEGYVIYYIGETMKYNIKIRAIDSDYLLRNKTYTVYVVHEYYESGTCDRWWYTSPPRLEDEPQEITYNKGDPLPNQEPLEKFEDVQISSTEIVLNGQYTSTLAVAAANDQTHVYIVSEDEDGNIELKIYDNPETGIFDPPAKE